MLHAATAMSALPAVSSPLSHRRGSSASTFSADDSQSDAGSADSNIPVSSQVQEPIKQTRQAKDWRPKSTLHLRKNDKTRTWYEKLVSRGLMSEEYHTMKPLDLDRGPMPKQSTWKEHAFILSRGLIAPAVQQLSYWYFPNYKWPVALAFPLYLLAMMEFGIGCVRRFDYYGVRYGTLQEKQIGRDRIPDDAVGQLATGLLAYLIGRTAAEFALKWDSAAQPIQAFSLLTPVKYFVWLLVMDYFFYVYHRSCHEIDWLWHIHSRHHTTKHPNPVLAIIADEYQEVIEIALVPLAATLLVPMNFHELNLLACYTMYVEIMGHAGIRADWNLPITGPILSYIACELIVEDHDLHHRYGKSGKNYGKQSRFWDVVFGTTTDREEMKGLPGHREL